MLARSRSLQPHTLPDTAVPRQSLAHARSLCAGICKMAVTTTTPAAAPCADRYARDLSATHRNVQQHPSRPAVRLRVADSVTQPRLLATRGVGRIMWQAVTSFRSPAKRARRLSLRGIRVARGLTARRWPPRNPEVPKYTRMRHEGRVVCIEQCNGGVRVPGSGWEHFAGERSNAEEAAGGGKFAAGRARTSMDAPQEGLSSSLGAWCGVALRGASQRHAPLATGRS
jgi:hypothetical protein